MMNYVQSSYNELNDRYQMRIFDRISASALGRSEPKMTDAAQRINVVFLDSVAKRRARY